MSGSLKNKILEYEPTPPPDLWNHISSALGKEFFASDATLASRLGDAIIPPPRAAWQEIESFLDNETKGAASARVIPILYKRVAIAVILAVALAVPVMYLLTDRRNDRLTGLSAVLRDNPNIKTEASPMLHVPSPAGQITVRSLTAPESPASTVADGRQAVFLVNEDVQQADINEACFTNMQTVDAEQPVSVPAGPIRDQRGNIIMDVKLIRRPDDPYITITSPNGSQTKISSKFLNCLPSLNADFSNDDTNDDGIMWKDKFQTWRQKLLSEDSFIPAASNFFDIFEMKDMIEEQ